jgi:hypothetical protein
LAKEMGRPPKDLDEDDIEKKISTCKREADGTYTKDSMS